MEKVNEIFKKIYYWKYIPFFVMFAVYFLIHVICFEYVGDDINAIEKFKTLTLSDYIINFCKGSDWSSRILINEGVAPIAYKVTGSYSAIWWCVVDTFFWVLAAVSFSKIIFWLFGEKSRDFLWIIIGIVMVYPFFEMSSAGWLCTTYSYLWPASIGIFILSCYVESLYKSKHWWNYILYGLGLVFAINIEGGAVFFAITFTALLIVKLMNKKINYSTVSYTVVSIAGVCWHLFSSGNGQRASAEVITWFKNYYMLSFTDRLELTFNRCSFNYIFNYNNIFFLFSIFLLLAVRSRCKDVFYRTIGSIPFIFTFIFTIVSRLGIYDGLSIGELLLNEGTITIKNYNKFSSYIPTLLGVTVYLSILLSFYILLNRYTHLIIALSIFAGGIGSWMIMIFSPTVWASGSRPFTTLNFVFLGLTVWLAYVTFKTEEIDVKKIQTVVWSLAMCNILNLMLQ